MLGALSIAMFKNSVLKSSALLMTASRVLHPFGALPLRCPRPKPMARPLLELARDNPVCQAQEDDLTSYFARSFKLARVSAPMIGFVAILEMANASHMNGAMTVLARLVLCCLLRGEWTFFLTNYHDDVMRSRSIRI